VTCASNTTGLIEKIVGMTAFGLVLLTVGGSLTVTALALFPKAWGRVAEARPEWWHAFRFRPVIGCLAAALGATTSLSLSATVGAASSSSPPSTSEQTPVSTPKTPLAKTPTYYFILDSSLRMDSRLGRQPTELTVAREWLVRQHNQLTPSGTLTALRTFGDGSGPDCLEWTGLKIPLREQRRNARSFSATLTDLARRRVLAPLDKAIIDAIGDIEQRRGLGGTIKLVVITGGYDTCWNDPFRARSTMQSLRDSGISIETYIVVAGAINDETGKRHLDRLLSALRQAGFNPSDFITTNQDQLLQALSTVSHKLNP